MGIEFTLAGLISMLSLGVAVSSFVRARKRDQLGDTRQWEVRIRALEDSLLQLDHYAALRRELPGRLSNVEYKLANVQEAIRRLEAGRGTSND